MKLLTRIFISTVFLLRGNSKVTYSGTMSADENDVWASQTRHEGREKRSTADNPKCNDGRQNIQGFECPKPLFCRLGIPRPFRPWEAAQSSVPLQFPERGDPVRAVDCNWRNCFWSSARQTQEVYQMCTFGDTFADRHDRWFRVDLGTDKTWVIHEFDISTPMVDHVHTMCGHWLADDGYVVWVANRLTNPAGSRQDGARVCYQERPPVALNKACDGMFVQQCYTTLVGRYVILASLKPTDQSCLALCEFDVYGTPVKRVLEHGRMGCENFHRFPYCCGGFLVNGTIDPNFARLEEADYAHCNLGLRCHNNICKYDFDNVCNEHSDCYPDMSSCEFQRCALVTNASCDALDRENHCRALHVCSSDGKCKLDLGQPCFQFPWSPYSCAEGLVCDASLLCKKANYGPCETDYQCQVGSYCWGGHCVCLQLGNRRRPLSAHCLIADMYPFGSCMNSNPPCIDGAECRDIKYYITPFYATNKCVCNALAFYTHEKEVLCILKHGINCSSNLDCAASSSLTVCENGLCRLTVNGNCLDDHTICREGAFCEEGKCKLSYGVPCESSEQCSSTTDCHATEKKCYIKNFQECRNHHRCSPHPYKCDVQSNPRRCLLPPGSSCAEQFQSYQCWKSAICEDIGHSKKCYLTLGGDCKDYKNDCLPPLICSLDKCRLPYDADCTGDLATMCAQGLACSPLRKKCHLDMNRPCLGYLLCIDYYVCNLLSGRCKIIPGGYCGHPYDPAHCPPNYTCLSDKCSIGPNENCEGEKAGHCQHGYVCDVDKTCKIDKDFSCIPGDSKSNCMQGFGCIGGRCSPLKAVFEFCDAQHRCVSGTVCDVAFKRCTIPPGGSCIPKDLCPAGFICYTSVNGGKCKLHSDVPCAGRAEHCPDGTQCDVIKSVCKIPLGGSCQRLPGECSSTTSCDLPDKVCRLKENQDCSGQNRNNCLQSLSCDRNNLCKSKLFLPCNPQNNACASGLECDRKDHRCYKAANGQCIKGEACANEYECDSSFRCKLGIGKSCAGERADHCKWGTTCDTDSVCKVSVGNSCSGDLKKSCRSGLKCDSTEYCRLELGAKCENNEDHCEVPSQCDSGSGFYCRIGLSKQCTPGNGDKCAYGLTCDPGFLVCRALPTGYCTDNLPCPTGYICDQSAGTSQCKLYHGGYCAMKADHCPFSDICSQKDQRCRIKAGYDCTNHRELCIEGASCSGTTNICLQTYGGDCSPEKGEHVAGGCTPGTVCDGIHRKCYISPYNDCSGNKICAGYYFCDTSRSRPTCRIAVGVSCVRMLKGCPAKTICDTDGLCRLVRFEDCSMFHRYCALGLQCDLIATRKCLTAFNMACQVDGECVSGLACDHLGVCRIKTNGTCNPRLDECVAGAKCESKGNRYVCACESGFSNEVRGLACKPRIGRASAVCGQGGRYCSDKNAQCINNKCVCTTGLVYDGKDFTCKRDLGSSCLDDLIQCRRGLICSRRGKCDLDVGSSCSEHTSCTSSAVCDGGICKVALNNRCNGPHPVTPEIDPLSCATDLVCDLITKLCKRGVYSPCNKYTEGSTEPDCVTGAECTSGSRTCACISGAFTNSGNFCLPVRGHVGGQCRADGTCDGMSQCKNDKCDCPTGFKPGVHTNACKLTVGSTCSREDIEIGCTGGSICDVDNKCKWDVGQMCTSGNSDCKSETVCDTDKVCRLDINEDCQDEPFGCRLGTTCTSEGTCKRPPGASCNTKTDCVKGAQCTNFICQCNSDFSYPDEYKCLPVKGRFGATCSERENQCADPTTMECKFGFCVCQQGMMLNEETLGCFKTPFAASLQDDEGSTKVITVLTSVSACLILLIGVLFYTKQAGWCTTKHKITHTWESEQHDNGQNQPTSNLQPDQKRSTPELSSIDGTLSASPKFATSVTALEK